MKRLFTLLPLIFFTLTISAADGDVKKTTVDGIEWTYIILSEEDKTCKVGNTEQNFDGFFLPAIDVNTKGSITIPGTLDEYSVIAIGDHAFRDCSFSSVVIPDAVSEIGNEAFYRCKELTSITLPKSLTTIKSEAFGECEKLQSLTIPASVKDIVNPFFGCKSLSSIVVEDGNTIYDSRDNCNAIIVTAENKIFSACNNSTIPSTVTTIGTQAFSFCDKMQTLTIPASVTDIQYAAFEGCSGLTSIIVEEGNAVYDSRDNCNAIINTSSNTVVAGCQNTVIPQTVTAIGRMAFGYCTTLQSVTIPKSCVSIYYDSFLGCSGIVSMDVEEGNLRFTSGNNNNAIITRESNPMLRFGCKNTVIPENVKSIGDYAFRGCTGLTSIDLPASLQSIGNSAFYGCINLTSINLPKQLMVIKEFAFEGCSSLTFIEIPASVTTIGNGAFFDCTGITSITSHITDPFSIGTSVFGVHYGSSETIMINSSATLYVPYGCKEKYEATNYWNRFQNIVEMDKTDEEGKVPINSKTFPHEKFRQWVYDNCDTDKDGALSEEEIAATKTIFSGLYYTNIDDLTGIEYFTALETLNLIRTRVESLDLSSNVALKTLKCSQDTYLKSLDISKNTALEYVDVSNTKLTSLDVSNHPNLKELYCSNCTLLESLNCSNTQLTSLDLSGNTALFELNCSNNQLTSLDVSENTALMNLYCNDNQLTSLDVSKNTALWDLECNNNKLSSLDVTKNTALAYLYCSSNQLTSLDVTKNTALAHFECNNNQLSSLDVTNNTALFWLECYENQLAELDVSKNTKLERLFCQSNNLSFLDVSNNTALKDLYCVSNQLTSLDLSKNTQLEELRCWNNQLTSLNVSNTVLKDLFCYGNQIKDEAMDVLVNGLPTVEDGTLFIIDNSSNANEGNVCTKAQVNIAKGKGWMVYVNTDNGGFEYAGSDTQEVDPTKVIEATCKQVIDGPDGAIYRVTGVCKEIINTTFGNWYLEDETGTIYIYGTVDSNGRYPSYTSWESFGINKGETITVQGPKSTYKDTPELVNVQVLRPLTLLSGDRININCEERVDTIRLYCEGDSYEVEIPADATWVTIKEQTTGKDPIVVLHIDENKGKERGMSIKISSTINGQKYEKTVLVTQHPYYFKAKTVEGVELSYRVTSESPTKTCVVSGAGEDLYAYYAALDTLTTGHVTIPAEVNGYTVTGIDFHAFENCKNITGVTMPETMTVIDSYAFKGCTSLADIHFSSSLNSLGAEIFEGSVWFANQPDGAVYINDSLLYVYKGEMPADTHFEVKEGCTYIGYSAFKGQSNLTSITLPETVKTIEGFAFSQTGLKEVTIPASSKMVQQRSFYRCSELESVIILGQPEMRNTIFSLCPNLKSVKCYSDKPWDNVYTSCFYYRYEDKDDNSIYQRATLYVPHGSKEAYQAVAPWSEFQNIVEMDLAPIDNGTNINIGSEINTDTNLDGNVVNNVLYNISSDNGSYDATEGCLVINKSTSDDTMSALEGKDIFGEDFQGQFTGVVFKVAEGSGTVKVQAETTGTMLLKVKIGNNAPVTMELEGKLKVSFGYDVTEETNVYIYAGTPTSQAKGLRKAKGASDNALKIYGIEVVRTGPSGIDDVSVDEMPQDVYSLSGQKIRSKAKDLKGLPAGVYIVGGKKVFVK